MCTCPHHQTVSSDPEVAAIETRRRVVQALAGGGIALAAGPALSGCTTNPVTGEKQLTGLIKGDQLNQMAAASWQEQKKRLPQVQDPRYVGRLKSVGSRIRRTARGVGTNWDYAVFDDKQRNAFVLPGGRVGFYKGMMDFTENESQIAAVMGHEVGHVAGRHAEERANQQMAGQLGLGGAAVLGSVLGGRGTPTQAQNTQALVQALGMGFMLGVVLPFSRAHERQADLLGVNYMHRAGYDKGQAVRLWEKMASASQGQQRDEFTSTHPNPADRGRYIARYIQEQNALGSQGFRDESVKDFDFQA